MTDHISVAPLRSALLNTQLNGQTTKTEAAPEGVTTGQVDEAIAHALERGEQEAPALAGRLKQVLVQSPEAFSLYLDDLVAKSQRGMASQSATGAPEIATLRASGGSGAETLTNMEAVLRKKNDAVVSESQRIMAKYSQFVVALSKLMTQINGRVVAEDDGKSNMNGIQILKDIANFAETWQGENGSLGQFSTRAEAEALANRFRSGTAQVFGDRPPYDVRFSLDKLAPVIIAVTQDTRQNDNGYVRNSWFIGTLKAGKVPDQLDRLDSNYWRQQIRQGGMNAHNVQGLSLAIADVQKTHQTDLDLLLNDFSRSVGQLDNLSKLYSSLMTSMTETLKSFLN